MKLTLVPLLTLLVLHPSYAQDHCKELTDVVQHYESLLQWKTVEDGKCRAKTGSDDTTAAGPTTQMMVRKIEEKGKPLSDEEKQRLMNSTCFSLATIESRIAELENKASLLSGFHKLKADLKENKEKADDKDSKDSPVAGLNFVNGLNAAESLELLLDNGGNMLKAVKGQGPADRDSPAKVIAFVKKQCDDQPKIGICTPGAFNPNGPAMAAINELINRSELKDAEIKSWQNAMAIKKEGGEKWSFKDMAKELRPKLGAIENGKLALTKEELKAVRALDKFTDAVPLNLKSMRKDVKAYDLMQEYKFHIQDLQRRQQYEVQSKAVLAYAKVKSIESGAWVGKLASEEKKACDDIKSDIEHAINCFNALKSLGEDSKFPKVIKSQIKELQDAAKISQRWMTQLGDYHKSCMEVTIDETFKEKSELPAPCEEFLKNTDAELSRIQSDLLLFNALKTEIETQNTENFKVRNLALATLMNDKECSKHQKILHHSLTCTNEGLSISPAVDVLSSQIGDVMVIQKDLNASVDNKWLCEDTAIKAYKKDIICGKRAAPPQVAEKKKEKDFQAPVTPPDGDYNSPATDAAINGLGLLAGIAAGAYFAPQPQSNYNPPYNPYMYDYSQYNNGYPAMGISDQLLFNARYYDGYGFYMPTPGAMPYTSFGGLGAYSSAYPSSNKSAYFGH